MKNLKVITLSILLGIVSIVLAGCAPVVGEPTEEEIIINQAFSSFSIPTVINNDETSLILPQEITISEEESPLKVIWQTSDKNVINLTGDVFHEDKNNEKIVTLTAKIYKNYFSKTKKYTVKVINQISSDGTLILEAMDNLTLPTEILSTDYFINLPISFNEKKYKDISISWLSSNKDIISDGGKVKHENSTTSYNVNISAILKLNGRTNSKKFEVIVRNDTINSEQQDFNNQVSNFNLGIDSIGANDSHIDLPVTIPNTDIPITWKSSSAVIDSKTGNVTHETSTDTSIVVLTAICSKNSLNAAKDFKINVSNNIDNLSMLKNFTHKFYLPEIITESTDILYLVDSINFIYPKEDCQKNGIKINWESSDKSIIEPVEESIYYEFNIIHNSKIREQAVTLTATCKKGDASLIKKFYIIVRNTLKSDEEIQLEKDIECLNNAKYLLNITNVVDAFADTILLPSSLPNPECEGVSITWKSSNSSLIDINGNVTHKENHKDESITLTATLIKGKVKEVKTFNITVKHPAPLDPIFENVIQQLPKFEFTSENLKQTYSLPASCTAKDKTVNIRWNITTPNNHLTLSSNELILKRDIAPVTETIYAILSYDNRSYAYEINTTLPPYIKFDQDKNHYAHFQLLNNVLETRITDRSGFKYIFSNINPSTSTITLLKTEEYGMIDRDQNDWYVIKDRNERLRKNYDNFVIEANKTNGEPSFENYKLFLRAYYAAQGGSIPSDIDTFCKNRLVQQGYFDPDIKQDASEDQLNQAWQHLSEEKIRNAVSEEVKIIKKGLSNKYPTPDVTEKSTWDEIIDHIKNIEIIDEVPSLYSYKIIDGQNITFTELNN